MCWPRARIRPGDRAEPRGRRGDARRPGTPGLTLIDAILDRGDLPDYRLAHAARAELLRRLGRTSDARAAFESAIALTQCRNRSAGFSSGGSRS